MIAANHPTKLTDLSPGTVSGEAAIEAVPGESNCLVEHDGLAGGSRYPIVRVTGQ